MSYLKSFILFIIAVSLFIPIGIVGFIIQIIWNLAEFDVYLANVAIQFDRTGNVVCPELLDLLFIKKATGHRFGNNETVSCVIGLNKATNTLTWLGILLYKTLNKIDENHCEKAVKKEYKK